jgi:hypothetical protein
MLDYPQAPGSEGHVPRNRKKVKKKKSEFYMVRNAVAKDLSKNSPSVYRHHVRLSDVNLAQYRLVSLPAPLP